MIIMTITDESNITHTFTVAKFELGVTNAVESRSNQQDVQRLQIMPSGSFLPFTFTHDQDENAVYLEKMLNTTLKIEMRMKEDEEVAGNICYFKLEFCAILKSLVTKPIELFTTENVNMAGNMQKMAQIATMEILDTSPFLYEADIPKKENGKINRKDVIAIDLNND